MLNFLAAMLIFAGWLLERRARKRAERERDAALEDARVAWGQREHFMAEAVAADTALMKAGRDLREQKAQNLALADRVAKQSEFLSRAAEREQEAARRLGYLFPRGLETPPSREDALSPTWCRGGRFKVGERVYVKDGEIWTPAAITGFEDGVYELAIDGCQFPARAMEPAIKTYEEFDRAVSEESSAIAR